MNNIAISPYVALHALQIQNIKRNVAKKIDVCETPVNISEKIPAEIVDENNHDEEIKS